MKNNRLSCALLLAIAVGGVSCGDHQSGGDSTDFGSRDAATVADLRGATDSGGAPDVSQLDVSQFDAGQVDAGQVDAGPVDAGQVDAGRTDAGPVDMANAADFGEDAGGDAGDPLPRDPFPSRLLSAAALGDTGFGTIEFEARDGNLLTAHIYRATGFDPVGGAVLFIMHGAGRTAESYLQAAAPVAERRSALAVAIEFDEVRYPGSESFTLGVGIAGTPDGPAYQSTDWRPVSDYTYSEVEHLFEAVRTELYGAQTGYYIFGHSAGAQYVHRLLTFVPQNRALRAVAANAGWYTLPVAPPSSDPNFAMPYGLLGTPVESDSNRIVSAPLSILVGSRDTMADGNLRMTPEANFQGPNRFARGQFYFAAGEQEAMDSGASFAWRFGVAPLARHDKDEVMPSAEHFLFEPGPPCTPSSAADASELVFNEIHADPDLTDGDANGDGTRDSADDEFVELVNDSSVPLCLTGWTLGDLADPERHVFPVDSLVPAGGAVVVFGGGVPTGSFGNSRVQWATFGGQLSLTNVGDVLTLRDANGTVVRQVSWGDCGTQACAVDHIGIPLDFNASMTRSPDASGNWAQHDIVSSTRFSPGEQLDGTPF